MIYKGGKIYISRKNDMSKANTKATINANIRQNGNQEITGQILNSVLNMMVDDYGTQQELTDLGKVVNGNVLIDGDYTIPAGTRFCNIPVAMQSGVKAHIVVTGVTPSYVRLLNGSNIEYYGNGNVDDINDFFATPGFQTAYFSVFLENNVSADTSVHVKIVQEVSLKDSTIADANSKYSLDAIKEFVNAMIETPTFTKTTGKYIANDSYGLRIANGVASDFYSSPIPVKVGDIITIKMYNVYGVGTPGFTSSSYSLITLVDENGVLLESLLMGDATKSKFKYRCQKGGYVSISFNARSSTYHPVVTICKSDLFAFIQEDDPEQGQENTRVHFNLCNEPDYWMEGYNYVNTSGGVVSTTGYYKTSNLLEIKRNSLLFIFGVWNGNGVVNVAFYDQAGSYLSDVSVVGGDSRTGKFVDTSDSRIKYVRFVIRDIIGGFRGYVKTIHCTLIEETGEGVVYRSPIFEKVVAFLGDSITAGANVTPVTDGVVVPYPYLVSDKTGCLPCVIAAPGGYFRYAENAYSIPHQAEIISLTPDIIVVEGGVNDYASGRDFGSIEYTGSDMYENTLDDQTFCGGLEKTLRTLATRFPGVPKIYVIATKARLYEWSANNKGQTYRDYVDEIVRCCKKYGFKVVNLHDESNLVPQMPQYFENVVYTYEGDNLHPTTLSYKEFYVQRVASALETAIGVS